LPDCISHWYSFQPLPVTETEALAIEQEITVSLSGLGAGAHTARIDTLKANSTRATNPITHPERIAPVQSIASIKGELVQHVMPAYSIQVVPIDMK